MELNRNKNICKMSSGKDNASVTLNEKMRGKNVDISWIQISPSYNIRTSYPEKAPR